MHSKLILNKLSSLIMVIKLCPGATAHLYITGASVRDLSYYQAFSCFQCWVFLRGNKLALSATSQETALSCQRNLADYFYLFKPRICTCVLRITVLFVLFHSFLFQYNHNLQLCSFFFVVVIQSRSWMRNLHFYLNATRQHLWNWKQRQYPELYSREKYNEPLRLSKI